MCHITHFNFRSIWRNIANTKPTNTPIITIYFFTQYIFKYSFFANIDIYFLLTYKQLRTKCYPLKKLPTLKKDKYEYYKELKKIGIDNIISIDETGFYLNMKKVNG